MSTNKQKQVPSIALILNPKELYLHNSCLNLLHVYKTDKSIDYEQFPLEEHSVKKYFKGTPEVLKDLLCRFNDNDISFEASQIKKKRTKSGIPLETFMERAMMRYLLGRVEELQPFTEQLKFYHRTINPRTGNNMIAPCRLSKTPVVLSFDVVKTGAGLGIEPIFTVDGERLPTAEVKRNKFLAERNNEYYLLRHNDFLILEWLQQVKPEQYAKNEGQFAERIVQKLEETHAVNRNDLFTRNEISSAPVSCIYLSEISESMLMLTPKWKYEGILIEGEWKELHKTTRNGVVYEIRRNKDDEQELIELLRSQHPSFQKQQASFYYLTFAEAKKKQWFLKAYHTFLEKDVALIGLEMLRNFRYSPHPVETELIIKKQDGSTHYLQMKVRFGKEEVSLNELQKLLLAGQHTILLKDNSIGVLTEEWLAEYAVILKHGKVAKNEVVIPQWIFMSLQEGLSRDTMATGVPPNWLDNWRKWQDDHTTVVYDAPSGLNASLRPYQQKGYEWLSLLAETGAGACLADDMGLGKTLQTIAFLLRRQELVPNSKFLIACPASLIYNWQQELEKFAPGLTSFIYNGVNRQAEAFHISGASVMICSYGTLRADIEQLKIITWQVAVMDESHNIKNISSLTTRAVNQLTAHCRVALSGTPVMNNTFDLYAQLNYLLPGLFGGQEFFRKEYATPIDRDQDQGQIKALQKMTAPFILRRTKTQVATDLPEKTESILWCDMGDDQRTVYEEVKARIQNSIYLDIKNSGLNQSKLGILAGIQKLRQACAAPALLKDEDFPTDQSVKIDVLLEELGQLEKNKALVFSQFKGMLHLIADRCREQGISFYHFDGDTPIEKRSEMVSKFQEEDDDTRLFLISLKAGNAGLNLTAADYVFLVDPWWNTAVQQQAIDRTHRIGQTKSVFAYKMICKGTIEEKIIALQQKKKALSEELISDENAFIKNLTEEDVAYLFG